MNTYQKKKAREQFEKLFGDKYLFADALQFGKERLEIKAMKKGIGIDGWEPTMFVIPTSSEDEESLVVDWEHPIIRPYNPKQDW